MAAHREIVGTFSSPEAVEMAVAALTSAGWDRAELSLLGPKHLLSPGNEDVSDTHVTADDPNAERAPVLAHDDVRQGRALIAGMAGTVGAFIAAGATILSGGTLLVAVIGSAALGGGAAAVVEAFGKRAEDKRVQFADDQLAHGGILLWAMINESRSEAKAREIYESFGAAGVEMQEFEGDRMIGRQPPRRDEVDQASDDSFPASDPPSFTPQHGVQIDPKKMAHDVERKTRAG